MPSSKKNRLEEAFLEEHSKRQIELICKMIEKDSSLEKDLMNLVFSNDLILAQRSSWAMYHYFKYCPERFIPFLPQAIAVMEAPLHDAQVRNILNIIQKVDLPEGYEAIMFDFCLELLSNHCKPSAIRVFAMQVAVNIATKYPELGDEIRGTILGLEALTPGIKSRWSRLSKKLN